MKTKANKKIAKIGSFNEFGSFSAQESINVSSG
jgi:hypothetical protein